MTQKKTCFVIVPFRIKHDYITGRDLDLDKTFNSIILPVFKECGYTCFRACDITHSGVIDVHMYDAILKSDFVLADLSTLNPNVLYELGMRHAVRKNTTIIIAEDKLSYPFDLSHIVIEKYQHLEKGIDFDEVMRFRKILKAKILELEQKKEVDSPLYTFFPKLNVPHFTEDEIKEIEDNIDTNDSYSDLVIKAEILKENENYEDALNLYNQLLSNNINDQFLIQRIALCTYKSKKPNTRDALLNAQEILKELKPELTNDPETLGLSGAINKRLYELDGDYGLLVKSLKFYERGYSSARDYYNGINAAYLLTIKSAIIEDKYDAFADFGLAIRIRKEIIEICIGIIESKIWDDRDDKEWVYFTLAEAYFGIDDAENANKYFELASQVKKGNHSLESYKNQQYKLVNSIKLFKDKWKK
jgi:tetratricopeptide (TPR) repeat protein